MWPDRRLAAPAATTVLMVLGACRAEPRAPPADAAAPTRAHAPARQLVYVSNEDGQSLTVIDATTDSVIATIPVGTRPRGVRAGPDSRVFVALSGSPKCPPTMPDAECAKLKVDRTLDGIALVDVAARRVERILPGGSDPEAFDISADGKRLFVSNEDAGRASIVDVPSGRVVATVPVGREPEGVGVRPDGREVWVTGETDHDVTIVGTDSGQVLGHIVVDKRPRGVAFAPDGRTAYVSAEVGGTLSIIDVATRTITTVIRMPESARPMGIAVSPDGSRVYVSTGRGGTVEVVDAAAQRIVGSVAVGPRPWGVALTPDGRRLYTANGPSNDVSVVSTETMQVVKRIPVGPMPWGVAIGTVPAPATR